MNFDLIKAWKDEEYRASLSKEQLAVLEMPVESNVDQDLILGGAAERAGTGWFASISGDCYDVGSCWNPFNLLESITSASKLEDVSVKGDCK